VDIPLQIQSEDKFQSIVQDKFRSSIMQDNSDRN
jgi:hypothetical protein